MNTAATAAASGAPLYQRAGGSTRTRTPAPPSGPVRRVNTIPVPKPTISAATFILTPRAASAAQAAKASAAQNRAMPSSADAHRCGRRNSTRMRYTESRNAASAPRQPARSRNLALYRPAAQKATRNPGTGMTAQGTVASAGGWASPDTRTAIAAPQTPMASTPCSRPASAVART